LSQAPHPVLIASQNLSGPALEWWLTQGRHVADVLSDWDVFRPALMRRFTSPADSHAARRQLQTVRQTAGQSVHDFMTQLTRLKSRVLIGDPITPCELAGHFWRGLSDTLRPFLIPLVGADVLNDIALLYKAAQQADLTLKSQGHAVGTKGAAPSRPGPSGSASAVATWATVVRRGKSHRPAAVPAPVQASVLAKRPRLDYTVIPPAERTDGSRAPHCGWPTVADHRGNNALWKAADACLLCGCLGHTTATCKHPEVPAHTAAAVPLATVATVDPVAVPADLPTSVCTEASTISAPGVAYEPLVSLFSVHPGGMKMLFSGTAELQDSRWGITLSEAEIEAPVGIKTVQC
jgi:Retrotransposon gag protein